MLRVGALLAAIFYAAFCLIRPAQAEDRPSISGQFSVSATGSATYILPIQIPPGAGGTAPAVALIYDSQTLTSPLGAGWTLSGYSMITRGPKTLSSDGVVAGPTMGSTDALYLDGQRLVPVSQSGSGTAKVTEYRKESDDVTRIIQTGEQLSDSTFRVQTKGGMTLVFDGGRDSRVRLADGTTLMLLQSAAEDTTGNYFNFHYSPGANGDYVLEEIQYTGNRRTASDGASIDLKPFASILFEYTPAERAVPFYVAGRLIERKRRLISITPRISTSRIGVNTVWQRYKKYVLEYENRTTFARYVLTSVRQFGRTDADEAIPTRFGYSEAKTSWKPSPNALPAIVLAKSENLVAGYRLAKVSASSSAAPDLLFSALIDGKHESFAFENDGKGSWSKSEDLAAPFAFATSDGLDLGAELVDLNGDGKSDLMQSSLREGAQFKSAYLADAGKWKTSSGYELPFPISENGKRTATLVYGSFSGAGRRDLLYNSSTGSGFLINDGGKWTAAAPLPIPITSGALTLNVDCAGPEEVLARDAAGAFRVYRFQGSWSEVTGATVPAVPVGTPADSVRAVDLNQDSCADLIISDAAGTRTAWTAGSAGWTTSPKTPIFDLVDAAGASAKAAFVDLNNDGLVDVIASREVATQKSISYAFLQTAIGWVAAPSAFIPNQPFNSPTGNGFLRDIDSDGFPDALFATGGRSSFGAVFKGSATGFQEAKVYSPPVAFARIDQQDRGVRFVDLNGDGLTDVLFNRKGTPDIKNAPLSGSFLNTAAGWKAAPDLVPPLPFAGDEITGDPARFVDVDGDGYIDLLYAYRRADGTEDRKFFHNETSTTGERRWVEQPGSPYLLPPTIYFSQQRSGDQGVQFLDLNGDGRTDLLSARLRPRDKLPSDTPLQICQPEGGNTICKLNPQFIDTEAYLNDGNGWVRNIAYESPIGLVSPQLSGNGENQSLFVQLADVTGDGLPDMIGRFKHPYDATQEYSQSWRNTGQGWEEDAALKSPLLLDEPRRNAKALVQWMDLNADGLPDILYSERNGAANLSRTWLGTGTGFSVSQAFAVPIDAMSDRGGDPSFRLIDANGDGLADIIYARKSADAKIQSGLFTNTGSAWVSAKADDVVALPPVVDDRGQDLGVRFFDINGDGLLDVVRSYAPSSSGVIVEQQSLNNSGRRSELLETIDAGHNIRVRIAYQSLQEPSADRALAGQSQAPWARVYLPPAKPLARPLTSPTPVTYVVRRETSRSGNAFENAVDYRYGEFIIDAAAMRTIGFGWREAFNAETRVLSRTEFAVDHKLAGKIVRDATCLLPEGTLINVSNGCPIGDKRSLTEVVNAWQTREQIFSSADGSKAIIRQNSLREMKVMTWEIDGSPVSSETTAFVYDEPSILVNRRLNALSVTTSRSDGTSLTVNNLYEADDPDRWLFGRLTASTAIKVGDVASETGQRQQESRSSKFQYDPTTGLLLVEMNDPQVSEVSVSKKYKRDHYGNILTTETTATGLRKEVQSTFDDFGRFEIRIRRLTSTRAYSTSKTYDPVSGAALSTTDDDNQLTSHFLYDGFERITSAIAPNGLTTRSEFLQPTEVEPRLVQGISAEVVVKSTVGARPPTYIVLDGGGRKLRTVGQGFTSNAAVDRPIIEDAEYDGLGRPIRHSLPYEIGSPKKWSTIMYDALDRRTKVIAHDNSVIQKSYLGRAGGGRRIVVTDASGRKTTSDYGSRGQLLGSTDALGSKVQLSYDAADRLSLVTGPDGAKIRTTYNYGRKVRVVDPDAGNWTYKYDGFGQMIEQTDGNGTTLKFSYDELGRPLTKSGGDVSVSWEYDSATHGVGQISKMIDTDKYEKSFTYDTFGRLSSETTKIAGQPFTTAYEYDDPYGTISKISLPSATGGTAFSVLNHYDSKGAQYRVTDEQGTPLWEAIKTNAMGQHIIERYGSATSVGHSYDPNNGRMLGIVANATGVGDILALTFEYDQAGNLSRRKEAVRSVDERFAYDQLHRLIGMSGTSGSFVFAFDVAGRLKSKTGVGEYEYRSGATGLWAPANGVLRIKNGGKSRDFAYDGNGNLIKSGARSFKYDAAGRMVQIAENGSTTTFDYDPNGVRYRQISISAGTKTETIYVGSYERITVSKVATPMQSTIRSRYAISSPTGVFAIVQTSAQTNQDQTTVGPTTIWYVHRDNLGSVVRITNAIGQLAIRAWYDPWGRQIGRAVLAPGVDFAGNDTRSFTGHEQFFGGAFIHMNGRIYDPDTGLFIMADPIGNDVTDTQTIGRFSYAKGNPLSFTDPSGYFNLGRAIGGAVIGFFTGGPGGAAAGFIIGGNDEAYEWVEQNWREVVIVGAAATVTVLTAGTSCALTCAIIAGAAGGATAGGLSAALYGGDINDVITGAVKGGFWGGVSAAGFGLAGASTGFGSVLAHGTVGGAVQSAQGGNFWTGFASASVARASATYIPASSSNAANVARAAAVGGATSSISGGKFANGAMAGAMSQAIAYASRRFGPAQMQEGRGGNVAFVGGAGDETMSQNVENEYKAFAAKNPNARVAYFTWDQSEDLADWIKSSNGEVAIYAHSYGADTAAAVVSSGVQVQMLVTVDPVSRFGVGSIFGPSYESVRGNTSQWINVYSTSHQATVGNIISGAGGAWGVSPGNVPHHSIPANDNHEDFSEMLKKARGN